MSPRIAFTVATLGFAVIFPIVLVSCGYAKGPSASRRDPDGDGVLATFHEPPYVSQINTLATFVEEDHRFSLSLVNVNGSCVVVVQNGTGTAASPARCPWEAK